MNDPIDVSLDETMTVDPLSVGEETALEKLRSHAPAIYKLREDIARLQAPGVGLSELRRIVDDAMDMQGRLGVPKELLTRDVLLQAQVPVEELEQIRSVLVAVGALDASTERARLHLQADQVSPNIAGDLEGLAESWGGLRQLAARLQSQQPRSVVAMVDLGIEKRRAAIGPLCDALLDKIVGARDGFLRQQASSDEQLLAARLDAGIQRLSAEGTIARQELVLLGLEVPSVAREQAGGGADGRLSREQVEFNEMPLIPPPTPPAPTGRVLALDAALDGCSGSAAANPLQQRSPRSSGASSSLADFVVDQQRQSRGRSPTARGEICSASPQGQALGTMSFTFVGVPQDSDPLLAAPPRSNSKTVAEMPVASANSFVTDGSMADRAAAELTAMEQAAAEKAAQEGAAERAKVAELAAIDAERKAAAERVAAELAAKERARVERAAHIAAVEQATAERMEKAQAEAVAAAEVAQRRAKDERVGLAVEREPPHGHVAPDGMLAAGLMHEDAPPARAISHGSPELWHAVHVGDEGTVTALVKRGACDGRMVDASGHSVIWHLVAFGHIGLATMMIETFPPGTEAGVDVTEVHQRRGDTLLHLLCQSKEFSSDTAGLFKRVISGVPAAIFTKVNAQGLTFLNIAAAGLNFWVLKYVCLNFASPMKKLICSEQLAPLRGMAEVVPRPVPPGYAPPMALPDHFPLAALMAQDAQGRVPFADVAFDVGPEDSSSYSSSSSSSSSSRGRFMAHRIVVAAQSPVLLEALQGLPIQQLPQEGASCCIFKVDARISKEVFRSVLQFLYTGVIRCSFNGDVGQMVELLRACALYKLPKPLLDYAQYGLFQLLPSSPPSVALQVFSITAGLCGEGLDVRAAREASAYLLMRGAPQAFEGLEPVDLSKIMEKLLDTVEIAVFEPAIGSGTGAGPTAPKGQAAAVLEPAAQQALPPQVPASGPSQLHPYQPQQWQHYAGSTQQGNVHPSLGGPAGYPAAAHGSTPHAMATGMTSGKAIGSVGSNSSSAGGWGNWWW